jgi:hypothetical protein
MGYTKEQVLDAWRKINELRPGMSFSCFHHQMRYRKLSNNKAVKEALH